MEEGLTDFELRVVDLFVNAVKALGLPKSVGEIYGLIYASKDPASMDSVMNKLGLSLGATSLGLKTLRSFGAVRTVYRPAQRKDLYVAEMDFRKVITQYLSEVLLPQFSESSQRLEELTQLSSDDKEKIDPELLDRVKVLSKVSNRANHLLPAISKVLSI